MDSILTVTLAAESFNLTTRPAIQSECGDSATDDLMWLDRKLIRASDVIARRCRRVLAKQSYSESFRPPHAARTLQPRSQETLRLREYPVRTIASVTVAETVLASTDYELDGAAGLLYRLSGDCRTCWQAQKTIIVYDAGYILPGNDGADLPGELEEAALVLMKHATLARDADRTLKSVDVPGVITTTYWTGDAGDDALPEEVLSLLQNHIRADRP